MYFLRRLGASLLENPLASSRVTRAGESTIELGEGKVSVYQDFQC